MDFLLDENLSPRLADYLEGLGHSAVHVRSVGLARSLDSDIIAFADSRQPVIVTADSDYPQLVALGGRASPSIIHLRGSYPTDAEALAVLIANQLAMIEDDLRTGAVVSLSTRHLVFVRSLYSGAGSAGRQTHAALLTARRTEWHP